MSNEHIYKVWAPDNCLWSPWVKPVLFACMDDPEPSEASLPVVGETPWVPPVDERVAMVLDLPREEGVIVGLELAGHGYRPVPLYNALPRPSGIPANMAEPEYFQKVSVVDVRPIMNALWLGTKKLAELAIAVDAPPVFLLDANRRGGGENLFPGRYDNRSVSFTTDFPSAIFLKTHGISRVILVQRFHAQPQPDLAHALRRWQEGGIAIQLKQLETMELPQNIIIQKPSWFGAVWYRVMVSLGVQRNVLGGYGGYIAQPSGG
ncbi:hypothetical protein [Pedosphaera parvula]|uniref:Uncharacterized protein n=1 Tax=Pedosphaera parvula (strain Ellin514) TaxID=320771 RepID=B9XLB8_PEDPL|nr:hypothetical protein [Pedosphaera parvula]EEF59321.1 hypothetical protein Cflav_PD1869 [Pedosphaera parvula Ellin514]